MSEQRTKYLILGGGIAGLEAALAIRQRDKTGRLVMISQESIPPYKRPMLSKAPMRTLRQKGMEMHDMDWYTRQGIELQLGCRVLELDAEHHRVRTDAGAFDYEKCVYALGAESLIPPFPGADLPGVISIRHVDDLRRLKKWAVSTDKAVVIGGGVIGLEMAVELRRYGMDITVLEAMPRLMPRQLDAETSERLLGLLGELDVHTGVSIAAIEGAGRVEAVTLEDGRRFPCGLVVVSCGIRANIDLAQKAGLACGRAVIVNERMETSARDIWACGDCAQMEGLNLALWAQAVAQGRAAGANAAGGDESVGDFDRSLILNNGPISLFALGDLGGDDPKETRWDIRERRFDAYSINPRPTEAVEKRCYSGETLTGGCIVGNLSGMEQMKREIEGRTDQP